MQLLQRLNTIVRSRVFHIVLLAVLVLDGAVLLIFTHGRATSAGTTRDGVTLLAPSVEVDPRAQERALTELAKEAPARGVFVYAITSIERQSQYTRVSVAGFPAGQAEPWSLEQAIWLGTVTLPNGIDGGMVESVMEPAETAPEGVNMGTGGAGDVLPFANHTQAQYGTLGVHNCGFGLNGWQAVDLFPSTDMVYAASSAEISYVCRDGTQMSLRAGDHLYAHLVDTGANIGDFLTAGQPISNTVHGNFNAICGNAQQGSSVGHVHFCFIPDGNSYTSDGYVLNTLSGSWTKGVETVDPLGYLTADWQNAGDIPNPMVGGNFWDEIAQGVVLTAQAIVPTLPVHQVMGIADTVLRTVQAPMDLLYAIVLANFNMTIVMWVFGIIITLESVRMIYSAWMWIKNAIPFAG